MDRGEEEEEEGKDGETRKDGKEKRRETRIYGKEEIKTGRE